MIYESTIPIHISLILPPGCQHGPPNAALRGAVVPHVHVIVVPVHYAPLQLPLAHLRHLLGRSDALRAPHEGVWEVREGLRRDVGVQVDI